MRRAFARCCARDIQEGYLDRRNRPIGMFARKARLHYGLP